MTLLLLLLILYFDSLVMEKFGYHFTQLTFCFDEQIVGANKGGIVALVEGLRGFVPFSQVSTVNALPSYVSSLHSQLWFFG